VREDADARNLMAAVKPSDRRAATGYFRSCWPVAGAAGLERVEPDRDPVVLKAFVPGDLDGTRVAHEVGAKSGDAALHPRRF
jgi:hypothetical protein